MGLNGTIIIRVLSAITFLTGLMMLIPISVSIITSDGALLPFTVTALITIITSAIIYSATRKFRNSIEKREGYLIVVGSWIIIGLISSLPYFFSKVGLDFTSSLFESYSGLTTTGATVFNDIEKLPYSILLWRSLTQWIGGMGIIVLTVAIFPLLGVGGVELFIAESPGPTSNKLHPRIKETAKRLWLLYVSLTSILVIVLKLEGMTWFDAVNHGLTTMATGGFSTKNASIAAYDQAYIQYTIVFFMFLAGINYTLIYSGIKGRFKNFWSSDEFKAYFIFTVLAIIGVTSILAYHSELPLELCLRQSSFQVISMITTTGFITADYTIWHPSITLFFFCLLFCGACAGSTSGGIKFIRHLVFAKNSFLEFKRLLHPNALIRLRIDHEIVKPKVLTHILVFLLIYLFTFLVGTIAMTFILSDFDQPLLSSAGAVATALGNVGPAIGDLGPVDNFSIVPNHGKALLSFLMLVGRLELFSVLILLTPQFWKNN